MKRHDYLIEKVRGWLEEQGFHDVGLNALPVCFLKPDLLLQGNNNHLIVEAKVANAYRSQVFPALVGDVILRAKQESSQAEVMIALLLRQINERALADIKCYANQYYPGLNWLILDESGSGEARLRGQIHKLSMESFQKDLSSSARGGNRGMLFSLNNQWLLKMLMLSGIKPRYWGGARERQQSIMGLSKSSGIPQSSVSAFVQKFEKAGFVRRVKGVPVVVRHRELLDEWFYAVKDRSKDRIPVRHMYGASPEAFVCKSKEQSRQQRKHPDIIIGHHLACHLYGIGRSNVRVSSGYICRPMKEVMDDYDLVSDQSSSPSFWLIPGMSQLVERGFVVVDGMPVCDILQCYLDVRGSQARGQEQADYILDNVLMPHFEGRA